MNKKVDVQRLMKEHRMRVVYMRPNEILNWFDLAQHVQTPSQMWVYNLPDDYILKDVRYDFTRTAFAFYILSDEFDTVKLGAEIPTHHGMMHRVVMKSELK